MKMLWMTALLLVMNQINHVDHIILTHKGKPLSVIESGDFMLPFPGFQMIDTVKFGQLKKELDKKVYQAPVDAALDDAGNIIMEQAGYRLDHQVFTDLFVTSFFQGKPSRLEVPIQFIHPKVDSELLSQIKVQRIGEYITHFNANNKTRTQNLSLAARAINNYVVLPEETFSFNKVVGKRTTENGYLRAPVIVKGELSEGIGGGICQVSSTLFNAVDRAGIHIVQRFSHSKSVPYVPPGRDATVSWYGPDFRFQNKYNQPILIRAKMRGGTLIVTIYSSETVNYKPKSIPGASALLH